MDIKIITTGNTVTLHSPYHPDLPGRAHDLDGHWDRATKTWQFDARDEQRVRELVRDIFGTDGTTTGTVTVRVDLDGGLGRWSDVIWLAGRKILERRSRDEPVRLGNGVILISGGFPGSGGSGKNPRLEPLPHTVIEVRDLPAGHPDLDRDDVTIVDTTVDRDVLAAERDNLIARLAEINKLLGD